MAIPRFFKSQWTWLGVVAALLVVIELANLLPYWRPAYWSARSSLDAAKTSIHQRGEPVLFADLAAENLGDYATGDRVLAVLKELTEPDPKFFDLMRADPPTPPGDYEILRETIRINRSAMDALAAIDTADECHFRHDFDVTTPHRTLLPSGDGVIAAEYLWRADVLQSLGTGDSNRAVRAVLELCDTAEFLRHEPFMVCQITRVWIGGHAVDALQLLLARVNLTPEQFQMIDRRLIEMEAMYRLAGVIDAERASLFTTVENIEQNSPRKRWASLSFRPERMRQQVWMLEKMTELARWIDIPGSEAERQWRKIEAEISAAVANKAGPIYERFPAIERTAGLAYRQRLVAARLALRVDRYRRERGTLPQTLDDVLDATMSKLPVGLLTGNTLDYNVRPDGFAIREAVKTTDEERNDTIEVEYSPEPNKN